MWVYRQAERDRHRVSERRQRQTDRQTKRKGELTLKGFVCRWRRASECLNVLVYVHSQVVK